MDLLDGGIVVWLFGASMVGAGVLGALFVAWVGRGLLEEVEYMWARFRSLFRRK